MHHEHKDCIEACQDCANACDHCATACLNEEDPKAMAKCIKLDSYCADLCRMAVAFMARADEDTDRFAHKLCALCAEVCEACAMECRKHKMDHCQKCADACEVCAKVCKAMSAAHAA